jgi:predicted dehydrogenase
MAEMAQRRIADSPTRLAIVGCGAVTELCHLPAVKSLRDVKVVALVDTNLKRASLLAKQFDIGYYHDDYRQLPDGIDGAIVALPNYLHAPVTLDLLKQGIPILVEKPMALTARDAEAMVRAADNKELTLQVALMYRFSNGARLVKEAVEEGWLGELKGFSLQWGQQYNWPVASGFAFSKERAGGGQLVDMGSHVLDLLLWWLGQVTELEYADDALGGVEADCRLSLVVEGPTGSVSGTVALSRLRDLGTCARLIGQQLTIEYDMASPANVRIWPTSSPNPAAAFVQEKQSERDQTWDDIYAAQLQAFAGSVRSGAEPLVPGRQVLDTVSLIEKCYSTRKPARLPWMDTDIRVRDLDLHP